MTHTNILPANTKAKRVINRGDTYVLFPASDESSTWSKYLPVGSTSRSERCHSGLEYLTIWFDSFYPHNRLQLTKEHPCGALEFKAM